MKSVKNSFFQMISVIRKDMMLYVACIAPVLAGLVFRFGIPKIEKVLCSFYGKTSLLNPYYELFDMFLAIITPVMFYFAIAMVILEERDDKILKYLIASPLGRKGYLISRFCIPFIIVMTITLILLTIFMITKLSLWEIVFLSFSGTLQGIMIALMIITLSSNKLEGMAVTKLSVLTVFGIVVPYFIKSKIQYLCALLPSFWMGKVLYNESAFFIIPTIIVSFIWILFLINKFTHNNFK